MVHISTHNIVFASVCACMCFTIFTHECTHIQRVGFQLARLSTWPTLTSIWDAGITFPSFSEQVTKFQPRTEGNLAVSYVFKKGHKGCGSPLDIVISECSTWNCSCEFAPISTASLWTNLTDRDSSDRTWGLVNSRATEMSNSNDTYPDLLALRLDTFKKNLVTLPVEYKKKKKMI